jgi:hypothetical protein
MAHIWRAGSRYRVALFELEREAALGRAVRSLLYFLLFVATALLVYSVDLYSPVLLERLPEWQILQSQPGPLVLTPELPPTLPRPDTPTPRRSPTPDVPVIILTATPIPP